MRTVSRVEIIGLRHRLLLLHSRSIQSVRRSLPNGRVGDGTCPSTSVDFRARRARRRATPSMRLPEWRPSRRYRPRGPRSEEHTSELRSLMRISYAVFCLKKHSKRKTKTEYHNTVIKKPYYCIHIA